MENQANTKYIFEAVRRCNEAEMLGLPEGIHKTFTKSTYQISASLLNSEESYMRNQLKKLHFWDCEELPLGWKIKPLKKYI